jgi:hypothetical protein
MEGSQKIFTAKEILEMSIFRSEDVLDVLEKENETIANKFKALGKQLEEDKNSRKKPQNKLKPHKFSPLSLKLFDLLEELKPVGLYQYRTALASKYMADLPWDDQNNFHRLINGADKGDNFEKTLSENPLIKLKLDKNNKNIFKHVKTAYEKKNPQQLIAVCQKVLVELLYFSSDEKDKIVQELIDHTFPDEKSLCESIKDELKKFPIDVMAMLYQKNKNLYKEFGSLTRPIDYSKMRRLRSKIMKMNIDASQKTVLIDKLNDRIERIEQRDNSQLIVSYALTILEKSNESLYTAFKKGSMTYVELIKGIQNEAALDYLSGNLLIKELQKRQESLNKIHHYKEIMSQEGITEAVIQRIEADHIQKTEIKQMLVSEIKKVSSEDQKIIPSLLQKEEMLREYLQQEKNGLEKNDQEKNQVEYTTAVNKIHTYKNLINKNQIAQLLEVDIRKNLMIFPKNQEYILAEMKAGVSVNPTKENKPIDKIEVEKKSLCSIVLEAYFQDAMENARLKIEEYEQEFSANPFKKSDLVEKIKWDLEISQQMQNSLIEKLEKRMANMKKGASQVVKKDRQEILAKIECAHSSSQSQNSNKVQLSKKETDRSFRR